MKRLPSGISNYRELIMDDYYYVDKTKYIEKIEKYPNKSIIFLRPRKFGKTLFTSMLSYYYDINEKDIFDTLFGDTYIGKNPTQGKNSFHILKFNFSGIDTKDEISTMYSFRQKVIESIKDFVNKYDLDYNINQELSSEELLNSVLYAFKHQKPNQKIYVIIDEYDHFANELLGFNYGGFKNLISKNGKVRKWYEILKEGTETVVSRIFITGVAPITLDSMTFGFNIADDLSRDLNFSSMMGFNEEEIKGIMNSQEIPQNKQEELLPIMKENYDGYMFNADATEKLYNSNMTLYFLNQYMMQGKIPEQKVDVNIASDYSKIGNMLNICTGEKKISILEKTLSGEGITSEITNKFNPEMDFGDKEMVSMLYYLGYLTIGGNTAGFTTLKVPNKVILEIYADYFLKVINEINNIRVEDFSSQIGIELLTEGKIDKLVEQVKLYLSNLSNRDYQRFDEKYIKLLFYSVLMRIKNIFVKSEFEVNREYPDLLAVPADVLQNYFSAMIEFKYLKKTEKKLLKQIQQEAKKQILDYAEFDEIKKIKNLRKYTVVAVVDEIFVEEI